MKRPFKCPSCGKAYFSEKEGCPRCQMSDRELEVAGILANDMLDHPMIETEEPTGDSDD